MNNQNSDTLTIDELDVVSGGEHSVAYAAGWLTMTVAIVATQCLDAAKNAASSVVKAAG